MMVKTYIKTGVIGVCIIAIMLLSGCSLFGNAASNLTEQLKGKTATIQTYDEEGSVIDRIQGKSMAISPDDKFAVTDEEGKTVSKSGVLSITIGGNSMTHVGSSLILFEDGIEDVMGDYSTTVDITNTDRSVPFVNKMVNDLKNITTGKSRLILVRSQAGIPIAAFFGEKVSHFSTDIDKSTGLLVDGKRLFLYRVDYTMYDLALLEENGK